MDVNFRENANLFAYMSRFHQGSTLLQPKESPRNPYMELGSHPDIVERVWDQLGAVLGPSFGRVVFCGRPSLVDLRTGIVVAVAWGTKYFLRLSVECADQAKRDGFATMHSWSNGTTTDIEQELGSEWVFGQWSQKEINLLRESYPLSTPVSNVDNDETAKQRDIRFC